MFETVDSDTDGFQPSQENSKFRCTDCKHVYTKKELLDANEERINAEADEIKDAALAEFDKRIRESFKKKKHKF